MSETNVATVTITVDEYFDLRQKAEANAYLIAELTRLDFRQEDFNRRMMELEGKVFEREYLEKGRCRRVDDE